MAGVELREARLDDHAAIAALERSQGLTAKLYNDWRRLWEGNPCYEEMGRRWPIGWVLAEGERIVGCLSNIPLWYSFRGRKLLAAAGRGWAVEDRYRGYAPLLMEEYFRQERVDLFLNNTVNRLAGEAFGSFGSLPVPHGDWSRAAFAVAGYRGFAESALRIKEIRFSGFLKHPAGFALWVRDRLADRRFPETHIDVTAEDHFDERFSRFWQTIRDRSDRLLAVRSGEVLRWHFGPWIEEGKLWVFSAERDGAITAYSVFQARDEPKFGLKRMRLVDFQAVDQHDRYCAAFMRRAYEECRKRRVHVLEQAGCELEKTRAFEQGAPYRRKLANWSFYYLTRDTELARQLAPPEAWAPSSYDGDASL